MLEGPPKGFIYHVRMHNVLITGTNMGQDPGFYCIYGYPPLRSSHNLRGFPFSDTAGSQRNLGFPETFDFPNGVSDFRYCRHL